MTVAEKTIDASVIQTEPSIANARVSQNFIRKQRNNWDDALVPRAATERRTENLSNVAKNVANCRESYNYSVSSFIIISTIKINTFLSLMANFIEACFVTD
jgi:hypothetical protein